jgi:hypothetical protein
MRSVSSSREEHWSLRASLWITACAALWLLCLALATSDLGVGIWSLFLTFYGGVALLAAWLLAAIVVFRKAASRRALAITPLLLSVGPLLFRLEQPSNPLFRVRFLASRASLQSEAEAVLVSTSAGGPHRVGMFSIDRVEVRPGQARFLSSCGMVDTCGIVYSPVAKPRTIADDSFQPLGGPWYYLYERF